MAYKAYILATPKDLDIARDLAYRLEKAEVKVFPVEKTVAEERIMTTFSRELREADEVFVIVTEAAIHNPGIISEMGAATSLSKRITPVIIGVDYNQLPQIVNDQYITYADLPKYIEYLRKSLEEGMERTRFVKARIGKVEANLLKPVPYTERPLHPPMRVGDKEIHDPVKIADQVILQVDAQENPDFVKAANDFNASLLLFDEQNEPTKATIQGVKFGYPIAEIRVQPESR